MKLASLANKAAAEITARLEKILAKDLLGEVPPDFQRDWSDFLNDAQLLNSYLSRVRLKVPATVPEVYALHAELYEAAGHYIPRAVVRLWQIYGEATHKVHGIRDKKRRPYWVWLPDLRSAHNAGAITRSAECFGWQGVILSGITAPPDHPGFKKAAMGCEDYIDIRVFDRHEDAVRFTQDQELLLYGMETGGLSKPLSTFKVPDKGRGFCLALGNEELGLAPQVMGSCADTYYIEMPGWKESLNVSNAFAVAAYQVSFVAGK